VRCRLDFRAERHRELNFQAALRRTAGAKSTGVPRGMIPVGLTLVFE
jgi:hypothetical protein